MGEVASRELRNNTRGVLDRVAAGEEVTITVDGRPVARLVPADRRRRWWTKDEFVRRFSEVPPDPTFLDDIRSLAPDTTDDLP